MRLLDWSDDLRLCGGESSLSLSPHLVAAGECVAFSEMAKSCFFEPPQFQHLPGSPPFQKAGLASQMAERPVSRPTVSFRLWGLLRPAGIKPLGNVATLAQPASIPHRASSTTRCRFSLPLKWACRWRGVNPRRRFPKAQNMSWNSVSSALKPDPATYQFQIGSRPPLTISENKLHSSNSGAYSTIMK